MRACRPPHTRGAWRRGVACNGLSCILCWREGMAAKPSAKLQTRSPAEFFADNRSIAGSRDRLTEPNSSPLPRIRQCRLSGRLSSPCLTCCSPANPSTPPCASSSRTRLMLQRTWASFQRSTFTCKQAMLLVSHPTLWQRAGTCLGDIRSVWRRCASRLPPFAPLLGLMSAGACGKPRQGRDRRGGRQGKGPEGHRRLQEEDQDLLPSDRAGTEVGSCAVLHSRRTTAAACPTMRSPTCSGEVGQACSCAIAAHMQPVLSGTKYTLKQARGRFGLGAKMVVLRS